MLPGIRGLRFLASQVGGIESDPGEQYTPRMSPKQWLQARARGGATADVDPQRFDPMDPSFLADPYPSYAMFRDLAPVLRVRRGDYDSFWVFSHDLVRAVCEHKEVYLKERTCAQGDRGLFYMDPPRHDEVRAILDPMFAQAIQGTAASAQALADEAIAEILAQGPSVELISAYANRVTRNCFMTMFGVPAAQWNTAGALIDAVLENFNPFLPADQRARSGLAAAELEAFLAARLQGCPAHPSTPELLCRMQLDGQQQGMRAAEVLQTALHFALGGYLSTQFLIGTGVYNLLSTPAAMARYRAAGPEQRRAAIEEMKRFDAPFQLADRYAATATRLGSCDIPAGAMVTVVYGSANRDERIFGADARQFRIEREIDPRLNCVFGHGIHTCIGAPMVAAVAPVVFDTLIDAMPDLALTGSMPQRVFDPYYRAFACLDLHF
jgi:cytochrome P450